MKRLLLLIIPVFSFCAPKVELGVDVLFRGSYYEELKGKRIGLITNQSGVDSLLKPTLDHFIEKAHVYNLVALFSPEHGINGNAYAFEKVKDGEKRALPVHSLHGATRRPTSEMLQGIDLLVYDIQDIGVRSYTYATTLFYVMEEAAKRQIPVMVLDRPNPLGGLLVDGPLLQDKWRSFLGYIDVPYCHGMTIGELAHYFNEEKKVGCNLKVVPMKGWKRSMSFSETGLHWIPTSPHIPEPDSALFCATTGILGELGIVSIGVGYTLPFKVVGAPWIDGEKYAAALNALKLPGVLFRPFHFRPFYGQFSAKDCQGVLIVVENPHTFKPLSVQFALIGILKSLYPHSFKKALDHVSKTKRELFCKAVGTERILEILEKEPYATYQLIAYDRDRLEAFKQKRGRYLRKEYEP